MTTTTELSIQLSRQLDFNSGKIPLRKPQGLEEIHLFRIYIKTIRQAEEDYLDPRALQEDKEKATQLLFGMHLSPLPTVCRTLGINHHIARLKLLDWKMKGLVGDPIFDFLTKVESANRFEQGHSIDMLNLNPPGD
jgi:hypothetical protein